MARAPRLFWKYDITRVLHEVVHGISFEATVFFCRWGIAVIWWSKTRITFKKMEKFSFFFWAEMLFFFICSCFLLAASPLISQSLSHWVLFFFVFFFASKKQFCFAFWTETSDVKISICFRSFSSQFQFLWLVDIRVRFSTVAYFVLRRSRDTLQIL